MGLCLDLNTKRQTLNTADLILSPEMLCQPCAGGLCNYLGASSSQASILLTESTLNG